MLKTIDYILKSMVNAMKSINVKCEVIIVGNYSSDGTFFSILTWKLRPSSKVRLTRIKVLAGL